MELQTLEVEQPAWVVMVVLMVVVVVAVPTQLAQRVVVMAHQALSGLFGVMVVLSRQH